MCHKMRLFTKLIVFLHYFCNILSSNNTWKPACAGYCSPNAFAYLNSGVKVYFGKTVEMTGPFNCDRHNDTCSTIEYSCPSSANFAFGILNEDSMIVDANNVTLYCTLSNAFCFPLYPSSSPESCDDGFCVDVKYIDCIGLFDVAAVPVV